MKKIMLFLCVLAFSLTAFAADAGTSSSGDGWDFFAFTFVPGVPDPAEALDVYGVKIGLPLTVGNGLTAGVDLSVVGSLTADVDGVQGAILFNHSKTVDGLQASGCWNYAVKVRGIQFSIVNFAEEGAFQVGIVNIIRKSPLMVFPVLNCWY